MTEREYNQAEGVRRSELWRMHESPEKYEYFRTHPEPPTPALVFGQVVHKLLLEPKTFNDEFAIAPDMDRRTKAGREAWEAFVANAGDRTVITQDEFDQAAEMVGAVRTHPLAQTLLNGEHEVPFFWTDDDTGIRCKIKCDILTEIDGQPVVVDYKTAASAHTDKFNAKAFEFGYPLQAAMYTEGVMKALGLDERPRFIFIAQEKKPPYSVNVIEMTEDVMMYGTDLFREYIGALHECRETGYWPGYNGVFNEINDAYLPGYMQIGDDDE